MRKNLSEMTLEELWQLFPILLTEHKPEWAGQYAEQAAKLSAALPPENVVRISHIGSTAVDGIWAKPIVDILVEVRPDCDWDGLHDILTGCGWTCMSRSNAGMSFNMGYTADGFAEEVFHLHLRAAGRSDELYFRDYLIDHPDIAREYEALKLRLWKRFEHDRDGYTAAKSDFVARITALARRNYPGRY